jgi:hypothetical protein
MNTGLKFTKIAGGLVLCAAVLSPAFVVADNTAPSQSHKKAKKPPQLPPLPSGPTGPVQPIPLDSMAPVPPQVNYQNSQLTIVAPNSTLADILKAVRKQTGADIDVPSAPERVVTHLGPGPARDVIAELLNGSRFNYVLLGSPADNASLTRVVLVAKTGSESVSPVGGVSVAEQQQPGVAPTVGAPLAPPPPQQDAGLGNDAEAVEENVDESADQAAAEAEQQQQQPANGQDQPVVKTPQEMLQEMQQRQLMLQQQQPPGQPPVPGNGIPPRPPQEQPPQ